MLDLGNLKTNLYEIKTIEGEVIKIKAPSQRLFNKMLQLQNIEDKQSLETINVLYDVVLEILNLNTAGKEFAAEYVEQFDLTAIAAIITDYFTFIGEQMGEL